MKTKRNILIATITSALIFSATALFAEAPAAGEAGAHAAHNKTLLDLFIEGGWVMYPIAACSIFTFYLIGDCTLKTTLKRAAPPQHVEEVKKYFRQGDYVSAYNYCKANPSLLTNVLRVGISLLG
jgi:biopolymer transport protein ExbB